MKVFKNTITIALLMLALTAFSQVTTKDSPNIIFFIVDDLGYYDLSVYNDLLVDGQDIYETPNIDALASEGILFTHGYEAAPRCTASRTSIMTGKFESRPSVSNGMYLASDKNVNGYAEITFAQALKNKGYKTFFIGKWHLGHDTDHEPDDFGFDINLGGSGIGAPETYYHPYGNEMPGISNGGSPGDYLTDRITALTNHFIGTHITSARKQPFLAMVSHYGVHTPLEARPVPLNDTDGIHDDVTYFQNKIDKKKYSVPEFENDLTAKTKLRQDNATYAAMIKSIDESLGSIRAKLVSEGIADNTVIIFTSDNGGLSTTKINGNRKLSTSSRPFRGGKTWLYEGGIRLPLIVYGPGYRTNAVENEPIVGTDFFPTMLEIAGIDLLPKQHLDGESFKDLLLTPANGGDATYSRKNPIIWDFNFSSNGTGNVSMAAIRKGDFKLLEFKYNNVFELYNVVTDPGETTDLSKSNPAKLKELKTALFKYRSDAGIRHRVTNSRHLSTNKALYDKMNSITKSNIQPDFGCATPKSKDIVYNYGHECWYDLDWFLDFDSPQSAMIEDAGSLDARTGEVAAKITVTNGGGFGDVRLINTPYYDNFAGGNIKVSTHTKSPNEFKYKIQVKVNYDSGSVKKFTSPEITASSVYAKQTFYVSSSDIGNDATESVEVRVLLGKNRNRTIFFDDWSAELTGITLSTPIFDESKISVYPNPTSGYIKIKGPFAVTKAYIFDDRTGELVKKSIGDVELINMIDLPKGIYILKAFVEGHQFFTKKIIKN